MKFATQPFCRWFVTLTLLFAYALPPSEAGIRGVLNGGGYAEMLALTNLQQLPNMLRPFLANPISNQISEGEKEIVELILELDRESIIQKIKLEFFTQSDPFDRIRYSKSDPFLIGLAHEALYLPSGESLSYAEISKIIFEAIILWPTLRPRLTKLKIEASDALNFTERLGHYASPSIQILNLYSGQVTSHLIHLKTSSHKTSPLLLIELHDQTININLKIEQHLACPSFELINITNLFFEPPYLSGKIAWTCAGKLMEGRMALGFEKDSSLTPPKYSVESLNVSSIREIENSRSVFNTCDPILK